MQDGIYRVKDKDGDFMVKRAIQVKDGKARGVEITTGGDWGYAVETFVEMSPAQVDALTSYGLHENQAIAWHTK